MRPENRAYYVLTSHIIFSKQACKNDCTVRQPESQLNATISSDNVHYSVRKTSSSKLISKSSIRNSPTDLYRWCRVLDELNWQNDRCGDSVFGRAGAR